MKKLFAFFSTLALLICMAMPTGVQANTPHDCDVGLHADLPAMSQGHHTNTNFEAANNAATAILITNLPAHYPASTAACHERTKVFISKFWEGQNTKASIRKALLNTKLYSENFTRTHYKFGKDIRRLS